MLLDWQHIYLSQSSVLRRPRLCRRVPFPRHKLENDICFFTAPILPEIGVGRTISHCLVPTKSCGYYKADCHAKGWDFYPSSFDSFATPGCQTRRLLMMWAQAAPTKSGSPPAKECRRLIIRIPNAIWQQATRAINRRRSCEKRNVQFCSLVLREPPSSAMLRTGVLDVLI